MKTKAALQIVMKDSRKPEAVTPLGLPGRSKPSRRVDISIKTKSVHMVQIWCAGRGGYVQCGAVST